MPAKVAARVLRTGLERTKRRYRTLSYAFLAEEAVHDRETPGAGSPRCQGLSALTDLLKNLQIDDESDEFRQTLQTSRVRGPALPAGSQRAVSVPRIQRKPRTTSGRHADAGVPAPRGKARRRPRPAQLPGPEPRHRPVDAAAGKIRQGRLRVRRQPDAQRRGRRAGQFLQLHSSADDHQPGRDQARPAGEHRVLRQRHQRSGPRAAGREVPQLDDLHRLVPRLSAGSDQQGRRQRSGRAAEDHR